MQGEARPAAAPAALSLGLDAGSQARTLLALGLCVVAYVYFVVYFRHQLWQPTVDLAWLVACAAWVAAFWRRDASSAPRLHQPYWFYALYVAALAPFASDWRWVMAGDNLSWPMFGIVIREEGLRQSLLTGNGPDNFAALPAHLQNVFMLLVEPTIFWHRLGKILIALGALAAIYTVFARLVRPSFGLLVAACASTCSVWIVYSYSSGMFINGLAMCFAILAVGLWVRRDLASRRAWLTFGWMAGLMLFMPPTGWVMTAFLWLWLGLASVIERHGVVNPLLAGVAAIIAGTPMMLQWSGGEGGQVFTLVQNPDWSVEKVVRFLQQAVYFPFASALEDSGAFGPQLPWGFRWLFVPGLVLAPLLGRRFPGARFVFLLWALHVASLAFAQGPYAAVSVKRALVLIPFATYFAFILFHRFLERLPVVLLVIAVWASFGIYDVAARVKPGRTGYTLLDGAVEAHQRFAPATVCVYLPGDGRAQALLPNSMLDRLYGLHPRLKVVADAGDPACGEVLCYCSQAQCQRLDLAALGYTPQPMYNTVELACGRRAAPPS